MRDASFNPLPFHIEKGFYNSLSQNGKTGMREQCGSFNRWDAVQYIHFHVPNYCVQFAVNKKDSIQGRTANLVFFVALHGSEGFTLQTLTELPPVQTVSGSCNRSMSCDAICLLPRCSIEQMCAAEQVALHTLLQGISGFIPKKKSALR